MASKTYIVTNEVVLAPMATANGPALGYLYKGAVVPDGVSQEWLDHHLSIDAVAEAGTPEAVPEPGAFGGATTEQSAKPRSSGKS